MKFSFIASLLLLLSTEYVFAKYSVCDQGNDCTSILDPSGKKNGIEVCKSGKTIRRKVSYKNDLKEGLWECFDQDGKLTESRIYKNDKKNGLHKIWQSSIQKFEECDYKNDELDGVCTSYQTSHSGGQTRVSGVYKTEYKNGLKHGFQKIYDDIGKEIKSLCYNKGQLVEVDKEPCNQKITQKSEKPLKKVDISKNKIEYYGSGKIKARYQLIDAGDYENYESFYENGQIKNYFKRKSKSEDFHSPDIYEFSTFTDTGLIKKKGICEIYPSENFSKDYCSKFNGTETEYDDKNEVLATDSYKLGKLDGLSIYYIREKQQKRITTYREGIKIKYELKDIKSDKTIETQEFFDDGSIKSKTH
ncbi:MAG: hypothetical protein L6Q37_09135 [Bdellovibrionaceae bacterium]|nr:hypothetical protein [Pseudobdellovibrionaceae bacterium]NUM60350.1 hypothetical protein [Pseudobdellovibrionaceae bacterium]